MKKIAILIFLISISAFKNLSAQGAENSFGKIGLSFSTFGDIGFVSSEQLVGGASYQGEDFYAVGINYYKPIKSWLDLETGIEYSNYTVLVNPNLPPQIDTAPYENSFSIISIPILLRAKFLKYMFINGGMAIDVAMNVDSPVDDQTGLEALLGIGLNYDFDFGGTIFINPYLKAHSLISFSLAQEKMIESGIRFGIYYKLNTK